MNTVQKHSDTGKEMLLNTGTLLYCSVFVYSHSGMSVTFLLTIRVIFTVSTVLSY